MHALLQERIDCLWAKSNDHFSTGDEKTDLNRIVCVATGQFSPKPSETRLLWSDDFFKSHTEPQIGGRVVNGFSNVAAVKGYIVVAAKAASSREMALYV